MDLNTKTVIHYYKVFKYHFENLNEPGRELNFSQQTGLQKLSDRLQEKCELLESMLKKDASQGFLLKILMSMNEKQTMGESSAWI